MRNEILTQKKIVLKQKQNTLVCPAWKTDVLSRTLSFPENALTY